MELIFDILGYYFLFVALFAFAVFLICVAITRWIFEIGHIVHCLYKITEETARHTLQIEKLNAKTRDIKILLTAIEAKLEAADSSFSTT